MNDKQNTENLNHQFCIDRKNKLESDIQSLSTITTQLLHGYQIIRKYDRTVTIFGSARVQEGSHYYNLAIETGKRLAECGFTIVTGGGNGIMGAANLGAKKAGGNSIGFNISLPHEQKVNDYITESYQFEHFAPRKIAMTICASAYVYFPGGFGTLDELAEVITLVQTGKTLKAPIILVGSSYWQPLIEFFRSRLLESAFIKEEDLNIFEIVDSVDDIISTITGEGSYCVHKQ